MSHTLIKHNYFRIKFKSKESHYPQQSKALNISNLQPEMIAQNDDIINFQAIKGS